MRTKRLLYFFLGFITALVVLVGSIVGAGFYFYNNGSIGQIVGAVGVDTKPYIDETAEKDIVNMKIKDLISEVSTFSGGDLTNLSLNDLQKRYGIKFAKMLDDAFPMPEQLFKLPINQLATNEGINSIIDNTKMDYIFRLAPDLFNQTARQQLSSKSIALLRSGDFSAFLSGVQFGGFLNAPYDEQNQRYKVEDINYPTITEALSNTDMGAFFDKISGENADVLAGIKYALGDVKLKTVISGMDNVLKEKEIADLMVEDNGHLEFDVIAIFKGTYMGDLLGYTAVYKKVEQDGKLVDVVDYWKHQDGSTVDTIMTGLANVSLEGLVDGSANADSLLESFGDIKIGEMIGLKNVDGTWIDKDTDTPVEGLVKVFADLQINELTADTIQEKINTVALKEILNCEEGIFKQLADSTLATIEEDIMNVKIGYALNNVYDNGVWKDQNGKPVSGIMGAVSDFTINSISTDIDDVKIGVVLELYEKQGVWYTDSNCTIKATGINAVLANYTIGGENGIAKGVSTITFGEVMGMYQKEDAWYKDSDCTIPADSLQTAVANLSLGNFNADTMKETINTVQIGDIFDTSSSKLFNLIPANTTIENLPTTLENRLTTITVADAIDLKIITIKQDTQNILDEKYAGWRAQQLTEFVSFMVDEYAKLLNMTA